MDTNNPPDTGQMTYHMTREERKIAVVNRKHTGVSFEVIGNELGISRQYAHELYWEALAEVKAPGVAAMREQQNAILQDVLDRAYAIAQRDHYAHSGGTIINGPHAEGETPVPLIDDGPKLAAQAQIVRVVDQMAKLNGTNAPVTAVINGQINYTIAGVDLEKLS